MNDIYYGVCGVWCPAKLLFSDYPSFSRGKLCLSAGCCNRIKKITSVDTPERNLHTWGIFNRLLTQFFNCSGHGSVAAIVMKFDSKNELFRARFLYRVTADWLWAYPIQAIPVYWKKRNARSQVSYDGVLFSSRLSFIWVTETFAFKPSLDFIRFSIPHLKNGVIYCNYFLRKTKICHYLSVN